MFHVLCVREITSNFQQKYQLDFILGFYFITVPQKSRGECFLCLVLDELHHSFQTASVVYWLVCLPEVW